MTGQHFISNGLRRIRTAHERRLLSQRRQLVASGKVEQRLIEFYEATPVSSGLVTLSETFGCRKLAIYSPRSWRYVNVGVDVHTSELVVSNGKLRSPVVLSTPKAIRRRENKLSLTIWDGNCLMTTSLPHGFGEPVAAITTTYFTIGEWIVGLEEEAIRGAKRRWRRMPLHRAHARNFPVASRGIGGVAALVVVRDGEPQILMHRRSDDVATNPGLWCAIPTYIVEDPRSSGQEGSEIGLDLHNLLREILEEAYGYPELVQPNARAHPDWFLALPTAQSLMNGIRAGTVQTLHLGWYVSLTNGLLDSLTLVKATGNVADELFLHVNASSTEVSNAPGAVRWFPLHGPELSELCSTPICHNGSALAIELARTALS